MSLCSYIRRLILWWLIRKTFEPKNRKRFIGKIATGEYDAVVIGHTQFEKIPMSKEYQEKHIQDQIDEIVNYVEEYKHDRNQNFTVKQLEKTKKKLKTRLEKLYILVESDKWRGLRVSCEALILLRNRAFWDYWLVRMTGGIMQGNPILLGFWRF